MSSWVRYSVAVYFGLLMAGTLGSYWREASAAPAGVVVLVAPPDGYPPEVSPEFPPEVLPEVSAAAIEPVQATSPEVH